MDVSSITLHLPHWRASGSRWLITSCRILNILIIPATALGHQTIRCSDVELVQLNPPDGMSCAQYMNPFISSAGGYLTNPDATTACNFCSMSTADQFLASGFNIFYGHAWRNFGLMFAYIVFNVRLLFVLFGFPRSKLYVDHPCVHCVLYVSCSQRKLVAQLQEIEMNSGNQWISSSNYVTCC